MPLQLSRGDIVLTPFPFTDLTRNSLRPALVVSEGVIGDDVVLAGISSVVRGPRIATDLLIESNHPEFQQTGLRVSSVVRLHKLTTVEASILVRRPGRIGSTLVLEVDVLLRKVLSL
jgi:mRNA interferase MazF